MKIGSRITSDIACCSDLLEAIFSMGKTDIMIFYALTPGNWFKVEDVSKIVNREKSTVYRSLLKLVDLGFVMRDSVTINAGGYYYVYALSSPSKIENVIHSKIDNLTTKMKSLVKDLVREIEPQ
jgi:predicted transcriptional regulator